MIYGLILASEEAGEEEDDTLPPGEQLNGQVCLAFPMRVKQEERAGEGRPDGHEEHLLLLLRHDGVDVFDAENDADGGAERAEHDRMPF